MEIQPVPIQQIQDQLFAEKDIELFIKREDLVHPTVPGNKWHKLKYNLKEADKQGHKKLLTFGGAFSNHIHATAGAGKLFGFETIGIIRGEEHKPLNPTLAYAQSQGMQLHYMDRETYRRKSESEIIESLKAEFGSFYLIPEGGTNSLAIKGCEDILTGVNGSFSHISLSVGTGGTIAGVISASHFKTRILGFSSLKGDFLTDEVNQLIDTFNLTNPKNWSINTDYHFGGYAKTKPELLSFMCEFEKRNDILLDPIYTAKALYGIYDLIKKNYFHGGSKILFIHTGGLQGRAGLKL